MEDILKRLTVKKELLDTFKPLPLEVIKNLDEWFRVELTFTSNALEGNTLTRQETALIVEENLTVQGKSIQEHLEAVNHANAFDFIKEVLLQKDRHELKMKDILDIHHMILHKINDEEAGKLRNVSVRLRGSETVLPNPLKVPDLMKDFMKWLTSKNADHPVKIAADAHYKLVSIHPFVDGNGRTARLIMNLLLMQAGYPPAVIRTTERSAYIHALEKAQTGGIVDDYYSVTYEAVDRSLDIYLESVAPEKASQATKVMDRRLYTTNEVAQLLRVDPESVRRYVRSGQLRAVKLGGRVMRIDGDDLEEFIERMKGS